MTEWERLCSLVTGGRISDKGSGGSCGFGGGWRKERDFLYFFLISIQAGESPCAIIGLGIFLQEKGCRV